MTSFTIHPDAHIGAVTLNVADLDRSLRFYEQIIGFKQIERSGDHATLGADGTPLLLLHQLTGARPKPAQATGLYHFAILLPTRADLGRSLTRLVEAGVPIGQADHLVSEALYLSDPDGNGIEIYRDRPREEWSYNGSEVRMASDPIDLRGLMAEGARDGQPWRGLPVGTVIGHVHLQVGDTTKAGTFYGDLLGFATMARWPGALFLGAGGYHHHLGLNTWQSRGQGPAAAPVAGLQSFEIVLPNVNERDKLVDRAREAGGVPVEQTENGVMLRDPWNNGVLLVAGSDRS